MQLEYLEEIPFFFAFEGQQLSSGLKSFASSVATAVLKSVEQSANAAVFEFSLSVSLLGLISLWHSATM